MSNGSIASWERKKSGAEADVNVAIVEWRRVTGAMERGKVQDESDRNVENIDRGGCVDGVSMSLVRAMSKGAKITPARPAAETAASREYRGDGDERKSRPAVGAGEGKTADVRPGSGRARRAVIKDREKDVIVEKRIEYT